MKKQIEKLSWQFQVRESGQSSAIKIQGENSLKEGLTTVVNVIEIN